VATTARSDLLFQTAEQLADSIRRRQLSPVELMEACLERIDEINPKLNAFVQLDPERGLREARDQAERLARGDDLGPLGGLPFGVKELENAAGFRTTAGSRAYADRQAERDDVHVARLRAAGAICIGKTNSPEFGYTAYTSNEVFGATRNPWDPTRTPGGSSGGSAAAIASGMVPLATASDGGGSIRIPACFVGAFGHKPTFGLVPIAPREMLPWTDVSVYGPLTRTVRDAALYLDQVAGDHPLDPTSYPRPERSYLAALEAPLPTLRIAFNHRLGCPKVQSDVLREVERAARAFEELGHTVEERSDVTEPLTSHWLNLSHFQSLAMMEDLLLHHRDLLSRGYAAELGGLERLGAHELGEAQRARARLVAWLADLFAEYDLLLTPTMPLEPFAAEGPIPAEIEGVKLGGGFIAFTAPFNFSGNPASTVRAGFTDSGLPVGLQIVGPRHADALVLRAAYAYEQARPWNDRWPMS
jgi:aspartyl-tRNA(Asn)/glutamyl-tRNA(Gln) amidotransferase subunit A